MQDEEWAHWNNSEIGRQCAVDEGLVRRMRAELPSSDDPKMQAPRTVKRGGKVYTMNIGRIGRGLADLRGEQDVQPEPPPAQSPDNVIQLGNRLNVIPSPEVIKRVSHSTSIRRA